MDKYSGGNHSHHHRHFPCTKNTITCIYVDATNLFIKAQNHSLQSFKNSIIHFFFQRDVHAKRSFCWPKATNVLRYKCCKASNILSSRTILHLHWWPAWLAGLLWSLLHSIWKCLVFRKMLFLVSVMENISTLGKWFFFSRMRQHEDFTETENCACMVQINRRKKRGVF